MSIKYYGWFDGIDKANGSVVGNNIVYRGFPVGNSVILYTTLITGLYFSDEDRRFQESKDTYNSFVINLTPRQYADAVIKAIKDNERFTYIFIQLPLFTVNEELYFEGYPNPNPSANLIPGDNNYINNNTGPLGISSKFNNQWIYDVVNILEKSDVANRIEGWYTADEPEISGYRADSINSEPPTVTFSLLKDRYLLIKEISSKPQFVWLTEPDFIDKKFLNASTSSGKFGDIVGTGIDAFYNGDTPTRLKFRSFGKKTKSAYRRLRAMGFDRIVIGLYGDSKDDIYDELYFRTLFNYASKLIPSAEGVFIWSWNEDTSGKKDIIGVRLHSWRSGGNAFLQSLYSDISLSPFKKEDIQNSTISKNEYRDGIKTKFVFTDKFITSTNDISGSTLYTNTSLSTQIPQGFYLYNKWTGGLTSNKEFATGQDRFEVLCYGWDSSKGRSAVIKTFPYGSPIPSECTGQVSTSNKCNPISLASTIRPDLACQLYKAGNRSTYYINTDLSAFSDPADSSFLLYSDIFCTTLVPTSNYFSNGTVARFWDSTKNKFFDFSACPNEILPSPSPTPTPTVTPTVTSTPTPTLPCNPVTISVQPANLVVSAFDISWTSPASNCGYVEVAYSRDPNTFVFQGAPNGTNLFPCSSSPRRVNTFDETGTWYFKLRQYCTSGVYSDSNVVSSVWSSVTPTPTVTPTLTPSITATPTTTPTPSNTPSPVVCSDVTLTYYDYIDIPNNDFDVQRQQVVDSMCNGTNGIPGTYYVNRNSITPTVMLEEGITLHTSIGCTAVAASGWYAIRVNETDCVGGYWDAGLSQWKYSRLCSSCVLTPEISPSPTPTSSVTPTPSQTVTSTPGLSPTPTPTPSVTVSVTPSVTTSSTPTPTVTPSSTPDCTLIINVSTVTPGVTPSPTPTSTVTPTPSVTSSPAGTVTPTPSITPTNTPTPTVTSSITPTPTVTPSSTPDCTLIINVDVVAPTVSPTPTPTVTVTPTPSVTSTPVGTITPTPSVTPTNSVTPSITPTSTVTPTVTPSPTPDCTLIINVDVVAPTVSPTPTPTTSVTPTPSITPTRTVTPSVTSSPAASSTPTPSVTPTRTATPSVTPSITPSVTRTSTVTPSVTPSNTATPSITPSVTPTNTVTPSITPTNTATPTVTPSITPSNTVTPSVTPSITPTSTVTPSITPSVTPTTTVTPTRTVTPTPSPVCTQITLEWDPDSINNVCTSPGSQVVYMDTTSFSTATKLSSSSTCNTWNAPVGYYKSGTTVRYWNGTVLGSADVCPSATPTPTPTNTVTPSVTPSTPATYNSLNVGYNAGDGQTACSNYSSLNTITIYVDGTSLSNSNNLYADVNGISKASAGYYSDDGFFNYYWNGTDDLGDGQICNP